MASSCSVKCILVTTILYYISRVRTEVPEYCLHPLNTSDCGGTPVTVMTYWKPGSRCELDVWKGCPTMNKFPDEYNCSATCIFRPNISEVYLDDEPAMNEWQNKLEKMEMTELKHMVNILDTVVPDTGMNEIPAEISVPNEIQIETTTTEEPAVEIADTAQEQESTEQDTTEETTTEHITTEQITTEHITTEHITTEHIITEHTTAEDTTTEHQTTEHPTTEDITTEDITTEHATTEHITTEHTTTEHSATEQAAVETNATTVKGEASSEGDSDEIDVVTTY